MVACHLSEDSKQSRDLMMTVCTAAAAANMLLGLRKMKLNVSAKHGTKKCSNMADLS